MRPDNGDPFQELLRNLNLSRIPPGAILIGLLVLIGIIIVWTLFYTVEADEVAVVQRVLKTEFGFRTEEPGVRTRFSPQAFPEEALMLTGDLNVGDVKWIVQYRIADPVQYLF